MIDKDEVILTSRRGDGGKILMTHYLLSLPDAGLLVENLSQQWGVMGHIQKHMRESKVSMSEIESF